MLLGYHPETGVIVFVFTDDRYVENMKRFGKELDIQDFWPNDQGKSLQKLFLESFPGDIAQFYRYRVVNGEIRQRPQLLLSADRYTASPGDTIDVSLEVTELLEGELIESVGLLIRGGGINGNVQVPIYDGKGSLSLTPIEVGPVIIRSTERLIYSAEQLLITITVET